MRIAREAALQLIVSSDHGVLCTTHLERGVDAVPAVFAVVRDHLGDHLCIPVDRVKPKASLQLQRHRNLEADPRATLLVDHWDRDDWSQLWWVRATLLWVPNPDAAVRDRLETDLRARYTQYRTSASDAAGTLVDDPIAALAVFRIIEVAGWSAVVPE